MAKRIPTILQSKASFLIKLGLYPKNKIITKMKGGFHHALSDLFSACKFLILIVVNYNLNNCMLLTVFQISVSEKSVEQHFEQDDEATDGGHASSSGNEASIVTMASLFT